MSFLDRSFLGVLDGRGIFCFAVATARKNMYIISARVPWVVACQTNDNEIPAQSLPTHFLGSAGTPFLEDPGVEHPRIDFFCQPSSPPHDTRIRTRTCSPRILSSQAAHATFCSAESLVLWDSKLLLPTARRMAVARLPDEEWRRPSKNRYPSGSSKKLSRRSQNRKCLQNHHKLQIRVSCPAAKSLAVTTTTSTMTPIRLTAEWPPRGQTSPSRQQCSRELRPKQACCPTSACARSCWA